MKKRALFIDRDGTIIVEPTDNFQIDSLQKLEFLPGVIFSLARIARKLPFELVMVTNQDGLGTPSLPEDHFWPPHLKMMKTLETEGISFARVHIDKSFEHENLPTRKPGIGMLTEYLKGDYDLANSYVIGDRLTDVQLAGNLGAKSILYGGKHDPGAALCTDNWEAIYLYLKADCQWPQDGSVVETTAEIPAGRHAKIQRKTNETDINVSLQLDSQGASKINTGIGFFDHMLEQLAKHSGAQLHISVKGDLHIDEHHTIEDLALALGEAYLKALGDKKGISRYGHFLLPMDETLAQVAIDFSGRPWLVWNADFRREKVGGMPAEMFMHFFKSFSDAAKCNLNIKVEGENEHHKIEGLFKAFARAIKMAVKREKGNNEIPSTKGIL